MKHGFVQGGRLASSERLRYGRPHAVRWRTCNGPDVISKAALP
jgi:hypothetical protein